jgi:hypothetical protein
MPLALLAIVALLALAAPAAAQTPGVTPLPIPESPLGIDVDEFTGAPAAADPHRRQHIPRHPFMAANEASNIHNDAYQSDTYNRSGPLGSGIAARSALFLRECASVTFDRRGRIVTVCVGLDHPVLAVLDPVTLRPLAAQNLPPRQVGGDPFSNFAGGGYFYLDHRDRAVIPTADRQIRIVRVRRDATLVTKRTVDLRSVIGSEDAVIAVMPDWQGRIWFASTNGVVGFVTRSGAIVSRSTEERIVNSFAVDETGGVFIVTNDALYRFEAGRTAVEVVWRVTYPNVGFIKPGQTQAGSGTTPTLMGRRWVAITDNDEEMAVRVYRRERKARGRRLVCRRPVFAQGAGATDQSLIGTGRSIVVENNFGHAGIDSTLNGATTSPGIERIDIDRDGRGCHRVWRSEERAPSVVPKLSLGNGLVYTYTKPPRDDVVDAWYLTAIDFDDGETHWRALAGTGFGFNNNFAPVSLGPDGSAYVGVLGGIVRFADAG